MPTIIDSLIIELGLDPTPLKKQGEEVDKQLNNIKDKGKKTGEAVEKAGNSATESISRLRGQLLSLFAAIAGSSTVKSLVEQFTQMDSALGRAGVRLGIAPSQLSAYENAARAAGAASGQMTATIDRLQSSMTELQLRGTTGIIPWLRALANATGERGVLNTGGKNVIQWMGDLAEAAKKLSDAGKSMTATTFLRNIGISDDLIPLMMQGRKEFEAFLKLGEKYKASKEDVEAATERRKAFELLAESMEKVGRTAVTNMTPALLAVANVIRKIFDEHPEAAARTVEALAGAITALSVALTAKFALGGIKSALEVLGGSSIVAIAARWSALAVAISAVSLAMDSLFNRNSDKSMFHSDGTGIGSKIWNFLVDPLYLFGKPGSGSEPEGVGTTPGGSQGATPMPGRYGTAPRGHGTRGATVSPSSLETGGFNSNSGDPGTYRPTYTLTDNDLSDATVNKIAGEAQNNQTSIDAVINNMMNRVGSTGWGPSNDIHAVAYAPGQYTGYRRATPQQAAFIRARMRAIASGSAPDNTHGSNEYRASWYNGPWTQKHLGSPVIGGNRFSYNPRVSNGPYAPYKEPHDTPTYNLPIPAGWMGAPAATISNSQTSSTNTSNSYQTHIGALNVSSNASSADALVADIRSPLRRSSLAFHANYGITG